jgi:uncharacterized protein (TIGR03086 family)
MAQLHIDAATKRVGELVRAVPDDGLGWRTPTGGTVGELIDHVQSFSRAFASAAEKVKNETNSGPAPAPDAAHLGADWRTRVPELLDALAAAWNEPAAWEGMTHVGGQDFPGEVAGVIALDEVVMHGWDLAVATGQPYEVPDELLVPLVPFLEHVAEPGMEAAREGLFGPVVAVAADAPLLHRVLGLAGRDPNWNAPSST